MNIREFSGPEIESWIKSIANLRIQVFAEFPYCYAGDLDNEMQYLSTYLKSSSVHLILVLDGDKVVGASTSLPLAEEVKEIQKPFLENEFDLNKVYYFGESVILPEHRGAGLGKEFFLRREAQAQKLLGNDLQWTTFCGVDRPENHPLRLSNYRNLHGFWQNRGYTCQPQLKAWLEWKDHGESEKSNKSLTFWTKSWSPCNP